MALFNESASVVPARELPESLKRGPLGGCLGTCFPWGGIHICEFILRVQSFEIVFRRLSIAIDHALVTVCMLLYFGCCPECRYCAKR